MTDNLPAQPGDNTLGDRLRYAQALAAADLLPAAYRRKPANVLLAMEYGHALGLDTVTAIQSVHVIEGKPTASAQLIGGLVRRAGHRLRVTGDDQHAIAEIVRSDDPEFVFRSEWTLARAQAAGLAGRGVWKQYPAAMLKARAITEVARDACPEALAGVAYTAEELGADTYHVQNNNTIEVVAIEEPAEATWPGEEYRGEPEEVQAEPSEEPLATDKQVRYLKQLLKQVGAVDLESALLLLREYAKDYELTFETLSKPQAAVIIETVKARAEALTG